MRLVDVRRYEMLARVRDFGTAHVDLFPAASLGGELFAAVGTTVGEVNAYGVANEAGNGVARERTSAAAQARDTLHDAMIALCRTARAIGSEIPGVRDQFRMPHTRVDQRLITTARAMAQEAAPHADRFVAHGLPSSFVADLTAAADAFAAVIQEHAAAKESRASATVGIMQTIAKGFAAAVRLDAIVKNQLAKDPELLAAWKAARHVSKRGLTYPPTTQPAPQPEVKTAA